MEIEHTVWNYQNPLKLLQGDEETIAYCNQLYQEKSLLIKTLLHTNKRFLFQDFIKNLNDSTSYSRICNVDEICNFILDNYGSFRPGQKVNVNFYKEIDENDSSSIQIHNNINTTNNLLNLLKGDEKTLNFCHQLIHEKCLLIKALFHSNKKFLNQECVKNINNSAYSRIYNVDEICNFILDNNGSFRPGQKVTVKLLDGNQEILKNVINSTPTKEEKFSKSLEINENIEITKTIHESKSIPSNVNTSKIEENLIKEDFPIQEETITEERDTTKEKEYIINENHLSNEKEIISKEDNSNDFKISIAEDLIRKEKNTDFDTDNLLENNSILSDANSINIVSDQETPNSPQSNYSTLQDWEIVNEKVVQDSIQNSVDTSNLFKNLDKSLQSIIHITQDIKQPKTAFLDKFSVNIKQIATNLIYGNDFSSPVEELWAEWIQEKYDIKNESKIIKNAMKAIPLGILLLKMREKKQTYIEFNNLIDSFIKEILNKYKISTKQWVDSHLSTRELRGFLNAFSTLLTSYILDGQQDKDNTYKGTIYYYTLSFIMNETYEHFAELFLHVDSNMSISKKIEEMSQYTTIHGLEICPEICLTRKRYDEVYLPSINLLKEIEFTLDIYEQFDILFQSYYLIFKEIDDYYLYNNPEEYEKDILVENNEITKIIAFIFLSSGVEVLPCVVSLVNDLIDKNILSEEQRFFLEAARTALNWISSISLAPAFVKEIKRLELENTSQLQSTLPSPSDISTSEYCDLSSTSIDEEIVSINSTIDNIPNSIAIIKNIDSSSSFLSNLSTPSSPISLPSTPDTKFNKQPSSPSIDMRNIFKEITKRK